MIKEGYISRCGERSLYPRLAPDDGAPAGYIECDAGTRPKLKPAGDNEPAPEMGTGRYNKVAIDLDISLVIGAFRRKKSVTLRDDLHHNTTMVREA